MRPLPGTAVTHLQLLRWRVGGQAVEHATHHRAQLQQLLQQQRVGSGAAAGVAQQRERQAAEERTGGPL